MPTASPSIARTLAEERNDRSGADVLTWAEAVGASILSHQRDFDALMPWAGLIDRDQINSVSDDRLVLLFGAMPALADLPDLCEAAISILVRHRTDCRPSLLRRTRQTRRSDRRLQALRPGRRGVRGPPRGVGPTRTAHVRGDVVRLSV